MQIDVLPPQTTSAGAQPQPLVLPPVDGVKVRRGFAWLIDAALLVVIGLIVVTFITLLGFLSLGLGFLLYPAAAVITIMSYAAITIGGTKQATPGMRMLDLIVTTPEGLRPPALNAAVHALIFYIMAPTFVLWAGSVLIGMMRDDARMGHDLVTQLRVGRASRTGLA